MQNRFIFNKFNLGTKKLDKSFSFANIITVNLTALSVRRDGGFNFYGKKSVCFLGVLKSDFNRRFLQQTKNRPRFDLGQF